MAVLAALKFPQFFRSRQNVIGGRTVLRFACSWVIGCVAANAFQPQAGSADPEREKDVYAIYSLMLTNPRTSHGVDNNERLLIGMNTKPPNVQLSCMRSPKDKEAEFREVLAGLRTRQDHTASTENAALGPQTLHVTDR
jgi:hypothetical protein